MLLDLRWIRTPEPIPPSLRDICQTQSRIGLIWKLRLNYDPKSWPMICWNKLDSLLFQFEHLECVEIHLHSLAYVLGREDEGCLKAAKAIAPGLQTTREKCGLKVYIEDVEILWKGTNEHQ